MPSNFTENYNLSQWDASDRVHHDDFNSDNLKIDAALAGKLGRAKVIATSKTATTGFSSGGFSTVPDWMKDYDYFAVAFDVTVRTEDVGKNFKFKFNTYSIQDIIFPIQPFILLLFPHYDVTQNFRGLLICEKPRYIIFDAAYNEAYSLSLSVENKQKILPFDIRYIGWN